MWSGGSVATEWQLSLWIATKFWFNIKAIHATHSLNSTHSIIFTFCAYPRPLTSFYNIAFLHHAQYNNVLILNDHNLQGRKENPSSFANPPPRAYRPQLQVKTMMIEFRLNNDGWWWSEILIVSNIDNIMFWYHLFTRSPCQMLPRPPAVKALCYRLWDVEYQVYNL